MANDNLSGSIVSMCLINYFSKLKNLEKTIRFIFIPETIGAITFLNKNLPYLKTNVIGGFNLSCVGDEKQHSCMFSKYENTPSDSAIVEAYNKLRIKFKRYPFLERGSDERQYNSPGIDLPIATIFRTKFGKQAEYHTSLDNFKLVTKKGISGSLKLVKKAIEILMDQEIPVSKIICEPFFKKRKLYPFFTSKKGNIFSGKLKNFLQYSDGRNDIKKISKLIKLHYKETLKIYKILLKEDLIN